MEVDRTYVDSDGDQVPDIDDKPASEPRPEQLGVTVTQGANVLDIVAVDEAGNASWKLIHVFSSGGGGQAGF